MKQKYIVSDTNIFLDLISVDLLAAFFSLSFEFHTTDFVIAEIKNGEQRKKIDEYVENGKLFITQFVDNSEMKELNDYHNSYWNKISIQDCSVWLCAKKMSARLLTGDAQLRKLVELENTVEVSGILFVFEEMIEQSIITKVLACEKLESLMRINPRLPKIACNEKITLWRKKRRRNNE